MKLFIFIALLSGVTFASEELIKAAKDGELATVITLIKKGEDVNEADEVGVTPLIAAAMNSQFAVANELIKAGAIVDKADKNNSTALMHAANKGAVDIVLLLLTNNANPKLLNDNNPPSSALNTALMAKPDDKNLEDYRKIVKLLFQGSPQFGPSEIPGLKKYLGIDPNHYIAEYAKAMNKLPAIIINPWAPNKPGARDLPMPLAHLVISYLNAEDNLAIVALEIKPEHGKSGSKATAEKKVTVIHMPVQMAEALFDKAKRFLPKLK